MRLSLVMKFGYCTVAYATPQMIESVKKAQRDCAAAILSRALHICKEKKVFFFFCLLIYSLLTLFLWGIEF